MILALPCLRLRDPITVQVYEMLNHPLWILLMTTPNSSLPLSPRYGAR